MMQKLADITRFLRGITVIKIHAFGWPNTVSTLSDAIDTFFVDFE